MTVHVLKEYERREVELPNDVVAVLVERHASHLAVTPRPGANRWLVVPGSHVGSIVIGEHTFLIKPKVRLRNLLAMMDIEIPSETWRREVVHLESDPDLLAVMARLFCIACEDATRSGIRRSYMPHEERLVAPRGRIDVKALIRRPGLPVPVPCRFDEHTADIPLNRLLRAGVERARRTPGLHPRWKRRLRAQLAEFDEVVTPVRDISWVLRWDPAPMERHYETVVRLAYLLLTQFSLRSDIGTTATKTFLLNMNDLFEKWVTEQLRSHVTGHQVEAQHQHSLGADGQVTLKPDITWWREGRVAAVADCKYKLLDDGIGRAPDYYQALAYATAYDVSEAWLIYARFPGDVPAADVPIRHVDKTVRTFGIDLTGPIENAIEQVRTLGQLILGPHLPQRVRAEMS